MPALNFTPTPLLLGESPESDVVVASERDEPLVGDALFVLVYRQMRLLTGNHRDLDDLAQTAIEQVLRARFEGRSKFSTFTYSVCYRVWLKHLRSFYRWFKHVDLETAAIENLGHCRLSDDIAQAEARSRVHQALASIAPKKRAVVLLHDIEELEVEDIAHIVKANVGTVRSRLRDGRKELANKLARDPYFTEDWK